MTRPQEAPVTPVPGRGLFSASPSPGGTQLKRAKLGSSRGGKRRESFLKKNANEGITKGSLRRLARRAGVRRMSSLVYDDVRGALVSWLREVLRDCALIAEHGRRYTVTPTDVVLALKRKGTTLWGFGEVHSFLLNDKRVRPISRAQVQFLCRRLETAVAKLGQSDEQQKGAASAASSRGTDARPAAAEDAAPSPSPSLAVSAPLERLAPPQQRPPPHLSAESRPVVVPEMQETSTTANSVATVGYCSPIEDAEVMSSDRTMDASVHVRSEIQRPATSSSASWNPASASAPCGTQPQRLNVSDSAALSKSGRQCLDLKSQDAASCAAHPVVAEGGGAAASEATSAERRSAESLSSGADVSSLLDPMRIQQVLNALQRFLDAEPGLTWIPRAVSDVAALCPSLPRAAVVTCLRLLASESGAAAVEGPLPAAAGDFWVPSLMLDDDQETFYLFQAGA